MSPQDPFGEQQAMRHRGRFDVLGVRVAARSNSRRLLALFGEAFGSLPRHDLGAAAPRIDVTLSLLPSMARRHRDVPRVKLRSGAGFLSGVIDANNFVMASAEQRRALVCVDRGMLAFPYHVRYELMEFAVYTLVPRVLGLVPLHGAAVASHGRAVLLTGPTGSGKSTAFLNCALSGLELLSEDAVFLEPRSLRATGCANFLHLRTDGMQAVRDPGLRAAIRRSPVIRRRSGVRKFEYDLRRSNMRVAPDAPRLAAVIALSPRQARGARLLEPLSPAQALRWLRCEQPYARAQASWTDFCRSLAGVPAYRLLRGKHPEDAADALRSLLSGSA
jgi:hypothetical protein